MAADEMMGEAVAAWTPQERESFFAAIERHQRAANRIRWLTLACALALGFVVAMLMAPLLFGLLGIILDVVNFATPTPDLFKISMDAIEPLADAPQAIPVSRWLYVAFMASIPGLMVMALLMFALKRVLREASMSEAGNFHVRAPDASRLEEQRFSNVIAEMALAAGLTQPRVLIIESGAANAAAFGQDGAHATVAVSTGMLEGLNRAQMQGIAGHLVGSIANGDVAVGTQIATTLSLFGLIAKLSESFTDRDAASRFAKLVRGALRHGSTMEDGQLALELTNPFDSTGQPKKAPPAEEGKVPWRTMMWMPLMGPLVISGFFGAMLSSIVLSPLLAWAWRRRKFLADATAVRLTRDADTLGSALLKLNDLPWEGAFAPWTAHMSVVNVEKIGGQGLFSSSGAKMFPSLQRRLTALTGMGASTARLEERSAWQRIPLLGRLALVPVGALVVVLLSIAVVLLAWVSVALSALFTWLPAMLIHAVLR